MKILLAADGSAYTKKALGFLVANESMFADAEVLVLNVQSPLPAEVKRFAGSKVVADYQKDEAQKVLAPVEKFLSKRGVSFTLKTAVGRPAEEICKAAAASKAQMIVMGTHGYGALGRAVMGSVAQNVISGSKVPVLLVR